MTLTKAEWGQVEERLKSFYSPVALMCDGYHVMLNLERTGAFQNKIIVYVDGVMQYRVEDCEERRRFYFPSVRQYYNAKEQKHIRKQPKWLQKQVWPEGADCKYTLYYPYWGSFKGLKAHLVKHNQSIELLKNYQFKPEKS